MLGLREGNPLLSHSPLWLLVGLKLTTLAIALTVWAILRCRGRMGLTAALLSGTIGYYAALANLETMTWR